MKKQTLVEYLEENCICDPNLGIDEPKRSVCGFVCHAKWHWSEEIHRLKTKMELPKRFDPPTI